jgi:hypothetical protein
MRGPENVVTYTAANGCAPRSGNGTGLLIEMFWFHYASKRNTVML